MFGRKQEALLTQTQLSRESNEFSEVEYRLKSSLNSFSPKIINVWSIANPLLTAEFERRCKDIQTTAAWVDTSLLDDSNNVSDVLNRNFTIPTEGFQLSVGSLPLVHQNVGPQRYEALLCLMGIGKAHIATKELLTTPPTIPAGFDSLVLEKNTTGVAGDFITLANGAKIHKDCHHFQYLIKHNSQVLPCYLIQFEYDPLSPVQENVEICDYCNEKRAEVYCLQDQITFCGECDSKFHDPDPVLRQHKRVPITEMPKSFGNCPEHGLPYQFFCPECYMPVCLHCKMIGHHSSGPAASHKLVPLSDFYNKKMQENVSLEKGRKKIKASLRTLTERKIELNHNISVVEKHVRSLFEKAMSQLSHLAGSRSLVLDSLILDGYRRLEEFDSVEEFIALAKSTLPPMDFLKAVVRHRTLTQSAMQHLEVEIPTFSPINSTGEVMVHEGTHDPIVDDFNNWGAQQDDIAQNFKNRLLRDQNGLQSFLPPMQPKEPMLEQPSQPALSFPLDPVPQPVMDEAGAAEGVGLGLDTVQPPSTNFSGFGLFTPRRRRQQFDTPFTLSPNIYSDRKDKETTPYVVLTDTNQIFTEHASEILADQVKQEDDEQVAAEPEEAVAEPAPFFKNASVGSIGLSGQMKPVELEEQRKPFESPMLQKIKSSSHFERAAKDMEGKTIPQPVQEQPQPAPMPVQPVQPQPVVEQPVMTQPNFEVSPMLALTPTKKEVQPPKEIDSPISPPPVAPQVLSIESVIEPDYMLSVRAEKRMHSRRASGRVIPTDVFEGSTLLVGEEKQVLYNALPFKATPMTRSLFSSKKGDNNHNLRALHSCADQSGPCIIICRSGNHVFGGYSSGPLNTLGNRFGTPKTFLFSITNNTIVPYTGRGDVSRILVGTINSLEFGYGDLKLVNDFTNCESAVENCYSCNLPTDSEFPETLLAGSKVFDIDACEVWNVMHRR
ncbi:hypothetical protein PCE1_003181 [Barthelona sp. PCE]